MPHTQERLNVVAENQRIKIKAKLTYQEMADLIGCSREPVSAILGQFCGRRANQDGRPHDYSCESGKVQVVD